MSLCFSFAFVFALKLVRKRCAVTLLGTPREYQVGHLLPSELS